MKQSVLTAEEGEELQENHVRHNFCHQTST